MREKTPLLLIMKFSQLSSSPVRCHAVVTTKVLTNLDRLHWQLVIPPEFDRPIPVRKAKIVAKKRIGSLRLFLDMSLDVIFEVSLVAQPIGPYVESAFGQIVSYLEPRDLLTLSRLSNEFRSLFMSRSSLAIWRRVLGQVPCLPECPTDLSEPQYASLLYDKFCMVRNFLNPCSDMNLYASHVGM